MIPTIISLIVFFILMAFFAGSEMAFLSCNKLAIKHLADHGSKSAQIVNHFQKDPKVILTTILIGTNVAHVTVVSLFTYFANIYLYLKDEWIITLLISPFIIILAETIPKDLFRQKANEFILPLAPIILFFEKLFLPLSKTFLLITDFFISFVSNEKKRNPFVTKEELRYIIDESAKGGVLLHHEKQLIHTILDLGHISVEEVMLPLKQFPQIELSKKVGDAKDVARNSKKPFILVYEEIPSIVVGIVYVFDILFEKNLDSGIGRYLHAPLFIPQEYSIEKTIFLLQSKHSSCAAVTNSSREVVGVVTIENLIRF